MNLNTKDLGFWMVQQKCILTQLKKKQKNISTTDNNLN